MADSAHARIPGDLPHQAAAISNARVRIAGIDVDWLDEAGAVEHVMRAAALGQGGWVATPNVDICRSASKDPVLHGLLARASLVVSDGMPLLWAARLRGTPLPERVTGASLIFSLSAAAARNSRSIYLLGGAPGVPDLAGAELSRRYRGLTVAGAHAPPVGFDATEEGVEAVRARLLAVAPDIVFVGLGFPKQERLIVQLAQSLPVTWFVACGAAIPFAAGVMPRAPLWMQTTGTEWAFRLLTEPRRLFRRYLVDDLPFAIALLATAAAERLRRRPVPSRLPTDLSAVPRREQPLPDLHPDPGDSVLVEDPLPPPA